MSEPSWNDRASEAIIRRVAAEQGKSQDEIEEIVVRARALAQRVRALTGKGT